MIQCVQCHQHLFPKESACPHCGAEVYQGEGAEVRPSVGALLLGLIVGACDGGGGDDGSVALYGVAMTDSDGDGFFANEDDCDDDDPDINPDAEEFPDDGVDSNCDGDDNT